MSVPLPGYFDGALSHTNPLINLLCGYGMLRCSGSVATFGEHATKSKMLSDTVFKMRIIV
jgi:hypothetical protein